MDIECTGLTPVSASIAVVAFLLALIRHVLRDARQYQVFKQVSDSHERQRYLRRWTISGFIQFGLIPLLVLQFFGRMDSVIHMPAQFRTSLFGLAGAPHGSTALSNDAAFGFAIGVAIVAVVAIAVALLQFRRAVQSKPIILGDVAALLPRNSAELRWATVMAVNAGVPEELYFRLLLPLLLITILGDATTSFVLAIVAFGLAHAYQGIWGIIATTVVGALFTFLYLSTGSLLAPVLVHIAIDLRTLVLAPGVTMLMRRYRRARA